MTLRFVSPMLSPMFSLFAVPAIVGIVAVTQLVSLDGLGQKSASQPIAVQPQNGPEKLVKPEFDSELDATPIAIPTEQERYNTTLSQIQDGDWLTQQGQFQAAKAVYHQALSQTQNADLAATATDRIHQLSRKLALKATVKPTVKSAIRPVAKSVVKLTAKSDVKPDAKPIVKSILKSVDEPAPHSIPQTLISPTINPIANPTASDLLPIPQPKSPDALSLGQSPFSETPRPAQTIAVESPQWDPEPPEQLN